MGNSIQLNTRYLRYKCRIFLASTINFLRKYLPESVRQRIRASKEREDFERLAHVKSSEISESVVSTDEGGQGPILVDGTFDNPNFWMRVVILRAALGFDRKIVGLIGPWASDQVRATFSRWGISQTVTNTPKVRQCLILARRYLDNTRKPADILTWALPEDFPPSILYDGVLKLQRNATVDLKHPDLLIHVAQALAEIQWAKELVESRNWSCFVLSHAIHFRCGALAWLAARSGIPCIVAMGNFGTLRFWKINSCDDISDSVDRPSREILACLPESQADQLATIGKEAIVRRLEGRARDVGAVYAYSSSQKVLDRADVADHFGWPRDRPIVAVYASNWFDYPHGSGMTEYADYYDWMLVTLDAAIKNESVSWLFRAHPADVWYGGLTLSDVFPANSPCHIGLCPTQWNGSGVINACDAFVTCVGTVGIEATVVGKPVLAAGQGFYHDCGFVVWASTRKEYISKLAHEWWMDIDKQTAARGASIFAGFYFGIPGWQTNFVMDDDSKQSRLYPRLKELLERKQDLIAEVNQVRAWLASDSRFLHTYKMLQATSYAQAGLA